MFIHINIQYILYILYYIIDYTYIYIYIYIYIYMMAAVLLFRAYIIKNSMQFFRKRAKKRQNGKIFENLGKNVQNLKIF